MYRLLVFLTTVIGTFRSAGSQQLLEFQRKTEEPIGILTTSAGSPVEYNEAIKTLNTDLISNQYFMESITHFVRERIPPRVVHAKGAGAFGYFEVTHNVTNICRAKLFSRIGKKTPVAVRFSPVLTERGGVDTSREPRGFAIKFYTEEGNFDLLGLNFPMFVIKDPVFFPSLTHANKRNPVNNLNDANMLWDFVTFRPEALHMFLLVFGDRGIPRGYRHMPGYGIHTFQVVNKKNEKFFVRFHVIPDSGIKNLYSDEARKIASLDPDYATRDLYEAINEKSFPSWTISIQILTVEDVENANLDVFDVTKVLPRDIYPLHKLGKLVLNKNPTNYFAEVEQLGYCPGNLVPGILGAPDKLFEGRRLAYREALLYRLGANFNKISVNCPMRNRPFTYNRDGKPPVRDNEGGAPNYYPNSFNGPAPYVEEKRKKLIQIYEGDSDNFEQARELYINEMTQEERRRVVDNIIISLSGAISVLQDRAVELLSLVHYDLGNKVYQGLRANITIKYNLH